MLSEHIQKKIIEKIKKENPQKVILFGSYASDKYHADSDIDLYIVTNDRFLPRSFKEKMDVKMRFSRLLDSVRKDFPMDIIVHTLPMHEKFIQLNSMFSREIMQNGKLIYEADNS